jgi:tetratricopeptide (TPR) repeat protein
MADVFLSYARTSAADAMRIADYLQSAGYSVWFDQSLPAHRAYSDVISEELDAAAAVLVLWSADATNSQWVRSESNRARETGRLVQLRLDKSRLPMPFDQIQCADLQGWSGDQSAAGWRTVLESIAALVHAKPIVSSSPPLVASRRHYLIAGGATLALAAAGGAMYLRRGPEMSPEAQLLLQKGMDALQSNDALDPEDEGSTAQAIALLTQASSAAPKSATAWGALALAYAVRRRASALADRAGYEARGRSAAQRALALDASEPRALAAQRIMESVYRNWIAAEEADRRALGTNPRFPILVFVLSDMLGSVGRWREATDLSNRLDRSRFLLPGAERKAILNLWSAGDLQAADEAITAAVQRWPDQRQVWRTRIAYLLYSGRPAEALAILRDRSNHPRDLTPGVVDAVTATAEALTGQKPKEEAISASLRFVRKHPELTHPMAHAVAALGDKPTVIALLTGYYFGEGEWAMLAPQGGDQDRQTTPLFQPPMRGLWQEPAFNGLLQRIGLNDYWRRTGKQPDFRG